ncbi:MAG TPA: hypothetical protein VE007_05220 [Thermoanaerobaculia bacterium]|nr:hypothetical protein [Thermoanaerobaculia bacterium]
MNVTRAARVLAVLTGALLASPVLAQDPSTWTEVAPKGGGFAIRWPGIPVENIDKETKARQFEIRSGDRRYFMSYRDLSSAERAADPAAALEKSRDAWIQSQSNPVLVGSEKAPLGSSPGLLWTCDTQAANGPPIRMRGKMVVARGRLYTLVYADRKFAFDDAECGRWFETFRLSP